VKKVVVLFLFGLILVMPKVSWAAYARDYLPLPAGYTLFAAYFNHVSANNYYVNDDKVTDNFNKSLNLGLLRLVQYVNIGDALVGDGGFTVDPQFIIPFVDLELSGDHIGGTDFSSSGMGDPMILATFWFVNDPQNKFWVGFTPWVTVPIGRYDKNRMASPGANRWVIKPEFGIVKGFGEKTYLDIIFAEEFYTDNNEYMGKSDLEQDPTFQLETHLSYDITKTWSVSLDYFFIAGGETKIDGVDQDNEMSNHGLGLTSFFMVGDHHQLLFSYRDDFSVESGWGDKTFGARWCYFF
jgi:hypothetical protein